MFSFFRKSIIDVDCFISNPTVYENFRIDKAIKFYPVDFKTIPKTLHFKANTDPNSKLVLDVPSIKQCNGVIDLFSRGFILPAWMKFDIETTESGKCYIASPSGQPQGTGMENFARVMYGPNLYRDYAQVKFKSPWIMKEKTGVKFTWNMCDWHRTDNASNVRIMSAVVDFKYQLATHVNMFIKNGTIISYDAGDPLVHMVPLVDNKTVKLHHHLVSEQEWDNIMKQAKLHATYPNHRKLKYHEPGRCPFSH